MTALAHSNEYENARQSRDPRFDGRFFVAVITTGIYCRPVCPVRIPKKENVQLYRSAAAAAEAGFRPCLRCRPESAPGTPAWIGAPYKVSKALQLLARGNLDSCSVAALAAQLSIGPRQLSRLFQQYVGASPVAVAQTQRLHFAKKLVDETNLRLSEVCFAAGFGSVRRFNAVFQSTYGRSPKELRKGTRGKAISAEEGIQVRLSYRPPLDWKSMLAYLDYRKIPGVEYVDLARNAYYRTIAFEDCVGDIAVQFFEAQNSLSLQINFSDTRHLYRIVEKVRLLFDLKADSIEIDRFFQSDALLKKVVHENPGTRVTGCWDGLEVTVRAILGQQVTVKAATTLAARVAEKYGNSYRCANAYLNRIFPTARTLATAELDGLGIVTQRVAAIKSVADKIDRQEIVFDGLLETEEFVRRVCEIKGIGDWTAYYIALRVLNDPNAFPYSDLILRRAAAPKGETLTPKILLQRAEIWKPWRAYAVILLWKHYQQTQMNSK
jgi:AraC family transcriptional regulator, regulatory protein of adaptative response / DNA-3-methyladenine glycosylase II